MNPLIMLIITGAIIFVSGCAAWIWMIFTNPFWATDEEFDKMVEKEIRKRTEGNVNGNTDER